MTQMSFSHMLVIAFTLFIALILSILPLPGWAQLIWPQWLALIVIYWVTILPHRINLGIAWFMGLLLDVLYGSLLGEHAFALMVVAYFADRMHRQMRMFPLIQQAVSIFILILIYEIIVVWIQGVLGLISSKQVLYWVGLSAFTSMLLWPWVYMLFRGMKLRYKID